MTDRRELACPERGWWKAKAALWPVVAERLSESGEPWPEEAVLMDLGWWIDQIEIGAAELPGRPTLCARWSWSEWRTRKIVADVIGTSSRPPAHLQPTSSAPPAGAREELDNLAQISSAPPADLQPTSSAPPALWRQTTDTDTDTDNEGAGGPCGLAPALPAAAGSHPAPVDSTATRVAAVASEWWRLWEHRRPKASRGAPRSPDLTKEDRDAIAKVVAGKKPKISIEEAITICRWAFYGQDFHARHLRGEASEDQQINEYLRPSSVYKPSKLAEKLTKARIFIEDRERKRAEIQRQTTVVQIPDEEPPPAPPPPKGTMRARLRAARADYV